MLPASNRGAGQNMGFPDVCNTPTPAGPVPIPYPNIAMNAQASPFCMIVRISGLNALNTASKIPMTSGDEAGSAHPFIKSTGAYTMGNPIVSIEAMPAINLTSLTTGNNMNNSVGSVMVPSVSTVAYTMLPSGAVQGRYDRELRTAADLSALEETLRDDPLDDRKLAPGVVYLRVARFGASLPTRVFRVVGREEPRVVVMDLRDNPGGDCDAMLRLAGDFLPRDTPLFRVRATSGDERLLRARQDEPYQCGLVLLVDGQTASAAELFAACMQHHGRAVVVGQRSYGKAAVQRVVPAADGFGAFYASVGSCLLPDGRSIEGVGVTPDNIVAGDALSALEDALAHIL
jgi:carboxyl-terminal processing protease